MRTLKSISALGNGERVVTSVADGGVAFAFETDAPASRGTVLARWGNDADTVAGIFADGSALAAIQTSPPPAPLPGQWWFEEIAGNPVMFVRHSGSNVAIAAPNGATTGVSSVTAGAGITASASSGPVVLSVDFAAVAPLVHTHDYLALDGSTPLTGDLTTTDGTASAPAVHGSTVGTGLFFEPDGVGFGIGGGAVAKVTAAGITIGTFVIPATLGATGTVLRRSATGVGWSRVAHGDLTGVGADDHHDQAHTMAGGDHSATPWRLFYSNATGDIVELTLGANNKALFSAGANAAPQWRDAMAKPALSAPADGVAYNFSNGPTTGFTATADGHAHIVVDDTDLFDLTASGLRVGTAAQGIVLPTQRGTVGAVVTQGEAGALVYESADAFVDRSYHRTFMFGR